MSQTTSLLPSGKNSAATPATRSSTSATVSRSPRPLSRKSAWRPARSAPTTTHKSRAASYAAANPMARPGSPTSSSGPARFVPISRPAGLPASPPRLASRVGIDPRWASGSDGALLDDDGRATFQKQYEELTAQLVEAKNNNDIGNIEKLQTEMNDLANEISRRTGLGGRSRERTDADRVRKAVSMAVSRDIERIASKHEVLGHHLQSNISSGLTFRYDPGQHIDWLT